MIIPESNFEFKINGKSIKIDLEKVDDQFLNEEIKYLDKKIEKLKIENEKWSKEHKRISEIHFLALEIEKNDPLKAIELHESIRDNSVNHFDTLGRLIILYRKTKQKDLEIRTIKFKIENEQNREYGRLQNVLRKFPEMEVYVQKCYDSGEDCILPSGTLNFKKKIQKLQTRLNTLL